MTETTLEKHARWYREACERVTAARSALQAARDAEYAANDALLSARKTQESCVEALVCAAGGVPYMMGGEVWQPSWEPKS